MSVPRQIVPGATYLLSRRCTQRQFWLRPSELTNQIIAYCVACAADRTGVLIHALCAMSNHWHCVATDPEGRIPEFLAWAHKYIAKCINASYGRWENLWATEEPSVVRLEDEHAIVDKIRYCLANPVTAGLVDRGEQWPGLRTAPRDVAGSEQLIERPPVYFRDNGPMPAKMTLRIARPPALAELSDEAFADYMTRLVDDHETKMARTRARKGFAAVGAQAVLAQRPDDRPKTSTTVERRRELRPRVAAKDKSARIEALRRIGDFVRRYRQAYARWREGARTVIWPAGTYAMRVRHNVLVAASTG